MASGCKTLSTYSMDLCQGSVGGVREIYLADFKADAATIGKDSGNTEIELVTAFDSGITWLNIPVRKNTSSMTTEAQISDENGVYFQTTVSIVLSRMDAAKRMTFNALAVNDLMCVVIDSNGNRWFVGKDNPVIMSAGTGQTGTQKSDGNNFSISIQDDSTESPYPLSEEVVLKTA